jgi:hypothetical protein
MMPHEPDSIKFGAYQASEEYNLGNSNESPTKGIENKNNDSPSRKFLKNDRSESGLGKYLDQKESRNNSPRLSPVASRNYSPKPGNFDLYNHSSAQKNHFASRYNKFNLDESKLKDAKPKHDMAYYRDKNQFT